MTVTAARRARADRRPAETGALARWLSRVGGRRAAPAPAGGGRPRAGDAARLAVPRAADRRRRLLQRDGGQRAVLRVRAELLPARQPGLHALLLALLRPLVVAGDLRRGADGAAHPRPRPRARDVVPGPVVRRAHPPARGGHASGAVGPRGGAARGGRGVPGLVAALRHGRPAGARRRLLRRRRRWSPSSRGSSGAGSALVGLAVGIGSAGLMAAPTGFVALAPLVAAAPVVWRWFRQGPGGWWAVAGRWVVVLAPAAVGSLLGFGDGAYRDFVRSQEIFAPIQRAGTWYQEITRYGALLDDRVALRVVRPPGRRPGVPAHARVVPRPGRGGPGPGPRRALPAPVRRVDRDPRLRPAPADPQRPDPPLRRPRRARGGVPGPGPRRRSPLSSRGSTGSGRSRRRPWRPRRSRRSSCSPSPGTAGTCGPTTGASGCRPTATSPRCGASSSTSRSGGPSRSRRSPSPWPPPPRAGRPGGDGSRSVWRRPCWPSSSCSRSPSGWSATSPARRS